MKHFFTLISLLGIIFSFQPKPCNAQKEFYNWYFGELAGMSFNTGSPVIFLTNAMNSWTNGSSNISDSLGNILFYTNGWEVRNSNNAIMPNGWINGASPTSDYDKINIAFQQLSDHSKYYIFCSGQPTGSGDAGLRYSVVDMNLDGGLGDIPAGQNGVAVPAANNAFVAVSATRHHNNRDVWVVARLKDTDSNYYASYLVNAAGINFTPVFSNSHIQLFTYPAPSMSVTSIKISRDGTKLAAVYDSIVEYCRFNSSTGEVTPLALTVLPKCSNHLLNNNTAEFSLDSKYLYISAKGGMACNPRYFIYQFDASLTDSSQFVNSASLITNENRDHGLQLAPDNKIYCSVNYQTGSSIQVDSLSVINNPSSAGSGCNYQKNILSLQGRGSGWVLPDYVERYYALIHDNVPCLSQLVNFTSAIWPPADTISWDFGDGGQSSLPNASHMFLNTGSYTVELYVRHIDNRTDTTRIVINILLKPNLGQDRTICNGDSATFDAGACPGGSYLWKNLGTGATVGVSRTFKAGQAGTYAVYVTNPNNCIGADTVQLITSPVPAVANTPPLVKTICSGETTNISLTSSPPGAMFHWTATLSLGNVSGFTADSGLVINQVLVNSMSTPGVVIYHITPKIGSCSGSTANYQVTVNPGDSVKVSITASNNNICSGSLVTFNAFPTNGGASPYYQWKVNGVSTGSNSSAFTYTPVNNDVVKCILTSSNTICVFNNPATSNSITMMVIPIHPVSVNIIPSLNPVCAGNSVTFTAYPVNGGSPPSYQWKVNGASAGTDNQVYSYIPASGDVVSCILTSNVSCPSGNPATSNSIIMTINPVLAVSVSVGPSQNPFCAGGAVTFTATPGNGGVPQYQWKVNGANAGTNNNTYTYNPLNGDSIRCVITSNLPCVTNNPASSGKIIMSSLPAPLVSFPFCFDSITTITAAPFVLKGAIPLGGIYSGPGVNSGTRVFTPSIAGVGTKTISYSYTNVSSCTSIMTRNIIVLASPVFTCGNTLTDIRDNKVYPTIQIGTQCWMQKNLNYGTSLQGTTGQTDNCVNEKYCYSNDPANCTLYGGLYQWDEVMAYSNTPGAQGLCPPGWHIPTQAEWITLFNASLTQGLAGKPFQDSIFNGFRAKESGVEYSNITWKLQGFATIFWSSNSFGAIKALSHGMNLQNFGVSDYYSNRSNAFATRCLKD